MSDASGAGVEAARYTAFGELIPGSTTHRYGYAGAVGYQTDTDGAGGPGAFPFMHVGARYYDPASGRFLQRDPIGISGGLNVYEYVGSMPTRLVDPSGLCNRCYRPGGPHFPDMKPWRPKPRPPTIQDQILEAELTAWAAGVAIGVLGCAVGGPVGWFAAGAAAVGGLIGILG